jgi:hypothetical protein
VAKGGAAMKKIVCSLALFVLIGLVYSNSYAQNLPCVSTESATNRSSSSATLNGRVNPIGTATEASFDREKTTSPCENATPRQAIGSTTVGVPVMKEIIYRAAKLQIPFIRNDGQVENDNIGFYAKTFPGTFSVTKDGQIVYTLPKTNRKGWVIREKLMGAVIVPPKGEEQAPTRVSYLKGSDPSKCKTGLPSYRFINLGEIYEGIELRLKAPGSNIEKLFLVKPDGHPDQIQIQVEGARAININERGELELMTDLGPIVFTKPIAYQEISGQRIVIPAAYRLLNLETENQSSQLAYGFSLGQYDSKYPLVIDPILASTFLGGEGNEDVYALALDSAGNVYGTGSTQSPDFPTTPGAYDTTFDGGRPNVVFISKFNADLTELLASTFLGWIYNGESNSIAIDSQDNVYVTGHTGGPSPTISKLNSDLTQVLGSTSFPTYGNTTINSIAVGQDGSIYAAGFTDDPDFLTTPGAYDTSYNGGDGFVSKFSDNLTQLLASTFLGGNVFDTATAITVDPQGYIVVTGFTLSDDFPSTPEAYDTSHNGGLFDVFVSKFNSDLTQLLASTFLGGNDFDRGWAIAVDPQGDIVVAGTTESKNFPTTPGAYKTVFEGEIGAVNGFVSRLSSDLTQLLASSFLGQGGIGSIFLEGSNRVFVVDNNVLEVLNGNLNWLIYSTPIGGGGSSVVIDAEGNAYISGYTNSQSFPTTPGAYDTSYNGGYDAFVLKMVLDLPPSYYADEYLPLVPGTIWKYLKNGKQTAVRKVLNKKVKVRGIDTNPVKFVEENVTEYLTSDSNGIFLHRQYEPHIYISGVGWVDIDVTFIPPIKLADGEVWIGQSFHSSGTARTLVLPLGSISNFYYTADSTIEAEETVTVPAGTFDTIRYRGSVTIYGQTLSMTRYLAKGIGIVKDVATNPQGKTATFELVSMTSLTLLAPTGGEVVHSGGTYDVMWESTPDMTTFKLTYSLDNGVTWVPIPGAKNVTENHYLWAVPIPAGNKKTCRVKVTGYNAANIKVKTDISDAPFTIEVVNVTLPKVEDILVSGETAEIKWATYATKRTVAKVKLSCTRNGGVTWIPIPANITGNPGTYLWTVPDVTALKRKCKVKVVLKDAKGISLGSDTTDGFFSITP